MKISTKSLKAIDAILDVAMLGTVKPITLAAVGQHHKISLSYLEHIFKRLREHGLVRSTRGPGGGYRLNRNLAAISIADIVSAVDGEAAGDRSTDEVWEKEGHAAPTRLLWSGLNDHLQDYLRSITLASLLDATGNTGKPASPPALGTPAMTLPVHAHHGDIIGVL